jgi:hypothetical protein
VPLSSVMTLHGLPYQVALTDGQLQATTGPRTTGDDAVAQGTVRQGAYIRGGSSTSWCV